MKRNTVSKRLNYLSAAVVLFSATVVTGSAQDGALIKTPGIIGSEVASSQKVASNELRGTNVFSGMSESQLWTNRPAAKAIGWPPKDAEELRIYQWSQALEKTASNPYKGRSVNQLLSVKPKMRRADHYPPQNEEEFRMWQWWHAMHEADRDAEWKANIEFYGIVVDQSNRPISSASVEVQRSATDGTPKGMIETGPDGRFAVTNVQGKGISVLVSKAGCISYRSARQGFEYYDIGSSSFHTPDPTNPVVFRLWAFDKPEPMYQHKDLPTVTFSVDDKIVWIDARKGRLAADGDLGLSILRNDPTNWLAGYRITIHARPGAGVKMPAADDELMFQAPESGYLPEITVVQAAGDIYSKGNKYRFYLKTTDNKYAAVNADISQLNNGRAEMRSCVIFFNPSGSRNLQYQESLRLTDK